MRHSTVEVSKVGVAVHVLIVEFTEVTADATLPTKPRYRRGMRRPKLVLILRHFKHRQFVLGVWRSKKLRFRHWRHSGFLQPRRKIIGHYTEMPGGVAGVARFVRDIRAYEGVRPTLRTFQPSQQLLRRNLLRIQIHTSRSRHNRMSSLACADGVGLVFYKPAEVRGIVTIDLAFTNSLIEKFLGAEWISFS